MHICSDKTYHCNAFVPKKPSNSLKQIIVIQYTSAFSNVDQSNPLNTGDFRTPLEKARDEGHTKVVRLLEAATAGLTNIALLSEEVLIISIKLFLRGIFCSCREVQRQTKVCKSPVGGCAHIWYVLCDFYRGRKFLYFLYPFCRLFAVKALSFAPNTDIFMIMHNYHYVHHVT